MAITWFGGGESDSGRRKPREEFMFGSEPIEAWRLWNVSTGADQIDSFPQMIRALADASDRDPANPYRALTETRLCAVASGGSHEPVPVEATCPHGHPAPSLNCECGWWALRTPKDLAKAWTESYSNAGVFGKVNLWGRYCEFDKGFRAQFSYPAELWVLDGNAASAAKLQDVYRVPVHAEKHPAIKRRQEVLAKKRKRDRGAPGAPGTVRSVGCVMPFISTSAYSMSGGWSPNTLINWMEDAFEWPEGIVKPGELWAEIQKQGASSVRG